MPVVTCSAELMICFGGLGSCQLFDAVSDNNAYQLLIVARVHDSARIGGSFFLCNRFRAWLVAVAKTCRWSNFQDELGFVFPGKTAA